MLLDDTVAILHDEDLLVRMYCGDDRVWPEPLGQGDGFNALLFPRTVRGTAQVGSLQFPRAIDAMTVGAVTRVPNVTVMTSDYTGYTDLYYDIYQDGPPTVELDLYYDIYR